jgi:hypothetical protein
MWLAFVAALERKAVKEATARRRRLAKRGKK